MCIFTFAYMENKDGKERTSFPEASPRSFFPVLLPGTFIIHSTVIDQHQKWQWDGIPKGLWFLRKL